MGTQGVGHACSHRRPAIVHRAAPARPADPPVPDTMPGGTHMAGAPALPTAQQGLPTLAPAAGAGAGWNVPRCLAQAHATMARWRYAAAAPPHLCLLELPIGCRLLNRSLRRRDVHALHSSLAGQPAPARQRQLRQIQHAGQVVGRRGSQQQAYGSGGELLWRLRGPVGQLQAPSRHGLLGRKAGGAWERVWGVGVQGYGMGRSMPRERQRGL